MSTLTVAGLRTRQRRRSVTVAVLGAVVCLGLLLLALASGPVGVTPDRSIPAIFGVGDRIDLLVVRTLQLPRALAAILAGAAFGLAGALFQSTLRNSLASPDILGISGGASLGAVTAILGFGLAGVAVTAAAMAGGLGVAIAIWLLAWRQGLHGIRFVLVGVGLSYVCGSVVAWWLSEADVREAGTALLWTIGSVADVRGTSLTILAVGVVVLTAVGLAIGREQQALALGDDHAAGLGIDPTRARIAALLVGVALISLTTAFAGPIAFVALVSPAIARRVVDDGGAALVASIAVGASLTLGADLAGQYAFGDITAPVGIVTGLIGAPYLLWLLARSDRKATT